MKLNELLVHFNKNWQSRALHDYPYPSKNRPAAVLIPLHEVNNELHVIFTKRAEHLLHHPGQVSFPGGKHEASDNTLIDTALREAHEEIGILPDNVEVIGQLPDYKTVSGFEVRPILGVLKYSLDLKTDLIIDANEVAEVFQVPLTYLLAPSNLLTYLIQREGLDVPVYFIPFKERYIWGATAGMLAALQHHLSDNT